MNPQQLADRLHELARQIESHDSRLQGVALGKSISGLNKKLDAFEKQLAAAVEGNAPGVPELGLLLKANAKLLSLSALRQLSKEIFGADGPRGSKPAQLRTAILKESGGRKRGEIAVKAVQAYLDKAKAPKTPIPKEETALLREFLRLGGLNDDAFGLEMAGRWKKVSDLRKLANTNKIPGAMTLAKADLIREIKRVSRRAHANVST